MKQTHILVVEDDAAIRRGLVDALQAQRYTVLAAADGDDGLRQALSAPVDLVLLDLMLPGKDGLEILNEVRQSRPSLPVIILTARGREDDRVKGLQQGADDYVAKPFSVRELLARVEAVLRRTPERPVEVDTVAFPGGTIDGAGEIAFDDGQAATLTATEASLLRFLASRAGRAVSRDEILLRVWGTDPRGIETRTVDMHVARLRDKLRLGADVIVTVRGKGYQFNAEAPKA